MSARPLLPALALALALLTPSTRAGLRPTGTHVAVNRDGVLVIDGRPVFPIGFTLPPPPDAKAPNGKNGIEELHDAGANFLRTGVMGADWGPEAIGQDRKWLDRAARYGMHCLINLRELASIGPNDASHEAMLRRVITEFRDHPGLGAWKSVDEPEWGKAPIPPMLRAREIIRSLDPHHPIEVTQAPRGTVEALRPYNVTADILGADIYPVSYPPGIHSLLPNREISMVGDYTRRMVEVAGGRLPVWMTLQIAWSGVIKPGKTLRFPTFAEERFMTYQAIINGARGLIYFGGHIPKAMTAEDVARGWNWRFWSRVLRPVVEEIGERSPLYPALVAPESRLPIRVAAGTGVEYCAREADGWLYLLACKREGPTEQVEFQGLPATTTAGEVLYEPPRTVTAREGRLQDWFGPFEVHVYRFRLPGAGRM